MEGFRGHLNVCSAGRLNISKAGRDEAPNMLLCKCESFIFHHLNYQRSRSRDVASRGRRSRLMFYCLAKPEGFLAHRPSTTVVKRRQRRRIALNSVSLAPRRSAAPLHDQLLSVEHLTLPFFSGRSTFPFQRFFFCFPHHVRPEDFSPLIEFVFSNILLLFHRVCSRFSFGASLLPKRLLIRELTSLQHANRPTGEELYKAFIICATYHYKRVKNPFRKYSKFKTACWKFSSLSFRYSDSLHFAIFSISARPLSAICECQPSRLMQLI